MKKAIGLALALSLTGCATGYQASGFGGGFSELPMSADTYQISYRGNAFTSGSATQEMALLRAAELAIDHGYTHFVVLGSNGSVDTSYYVQPGTTVATVNPTGFGGYTATANTYGGYVAPINKPRTEMVVRFVSADAGGIDAATIIETLGPKYAN